MKKLENNKLYQGILKCPSSKSYMQRAISIALLADGDTHITNSCFCDDVEAVLEIAVNLGATITRKKTEIWISPGGKLRKTELNVGESGLGIRMLTPIASLFSEDITLTGEGSLKNRPMLTLENSLSLLGVEIRTNNGLLPIHVKGPLKGGKISIDGRLGSQVLTGLLISLPKVTQSSLLEVIDLQSKPYIDMTIEIMAQFGVKLSHDNYIKFSVPGGQHYHGIKYKNEGDWSGAAFHLVGGAIAGDITLFDINILSKQADIKILEALRLAKSNVTIEKNKIRVRKSELKAFNFDATNCPDLFPPLSNLAVACKGVSVIKGVGRLIHKESNRAEVLLKVWREMGVEIQVIGDEMHIKGGPVKGGEIFSYNDHRIAMMGAISSLIASSPVYIKNPEAVTKSYPTFYEEYDTLIQ